MITTILICMLLTVMSALFSGLTLGLLGLDKFEVQRKMKLGDARAAKVWEVRKEGNRLLTTLLLSNVLVNAILPTYLSSIATGAITVAGSTAILFLFGEVIPQAVISRHALSFGAKTAWLVKGLMWVLYPINKPVAWCLDKCLGEELKTIYHKQELAEIITEHAEDPESNIDDTEKKIIHGALSLAEKTVEEVMTPIENITMFHSDASIADITNQVRETGHTRFPVYDKNRNDIVGILLVKNLFGINPKKKLRSINTLQPYSVENTCNLDDAQTLSIEKKHHMLIVRDGQTVIGLITLEDILEEILDVEIVDETDQHIDMRKIKKTKQHN